MIRRIVWLLIILGLAYSIYRWIDPMGAEELVTRIQSYFDKEKQEDVSIVEENPENVVVEEDIEITTAPVYTGTINTGSSVELDYVLSESSQTTTGSQSTGSVTSTPNTTTTTTTTPTQSTSPASKPSTTTTKKSLSNQDEADMKAFLNAIVE